MLRVWCVVCLEVRRQAQQLTQQGVAHGRLAGGGARGRWGGGSPMAAMAAGQQHGGSTAATPPGWLLAAGPTMLDI